MSSLLTEATRTLGHPGASSGPRTVVGVLAIVILLVVLVMREMARAELTDARAGRVRRLHFATVPLTMVFIAVVTPRIVDLLT